jgi:hypothetical protein
MSKKVKPDFNKSETKEENFEQIVRTEMKDSPFIVVTTKNGSFGTLGKYRLTEVYKTKEEAIDEMSNFTWNRIVQVISLINNILNNEK